MSTFKRLFFINDANAKHLPVLDGLRGLAVLIVLLAHTSREGLFFFEGFNFTGAGKPGVYLFFVLSAYLLDKQIIESYYSDKVSAKFWANYFVRRFMRIYPLFFIAIMTHWILHMIGVKNVIDSGKDVVLHLLLVKGESIFWSIPVEFKYYFISPLLMYFFYKLTFRRRKILIFQKNSSTVRYGHRLSF